MINVKSKLIWNALCSFCCNDDRFMFPEYLDRSGKGEFTEAVA